MNRCRKISRALAFVGFYALAGAMALPASAAPLCARVMMPEISAADISLTVTALAEMKLRMDLLKSEGASSAEMILLNELYPAKYQELVQSLQNKMPIAEVRALLVEKIRELQRKQGQEKKEETRTRQGERANHGQYVFDKRIELPRRTHGDFFEYLPEHDFILYQARDNMNFVRRNMKTGEEFDFALGEGNRRAHLLPDRRTLLITDLLVGVWLVDVMTGQKTALQNFINQGSKVYSTVDPKGEILVLSFNDKATVYDLKTQTAEYLEINLGIAPIAISKNLILTQGLDPYIYDITTKQAQPLPKRKSPQHISFLNEDRSQFMIHEDHGGKISFFDIANLQIPLKRSARDVTEQTMPPKMFSFSKLPGKKLYLGKTSSSSPRLYIFTPADFKNPVFEFVDLISDAEMKTSQLVYRFSADSESAGILRKSVSMTTESSHIDIWKVLR